MALRSEVVGTADFVPKLVLGYVSVRSHDGMSVLEAEDLSDSQSFHGDDRLRAKVRSRIEALGFVLVAESKLGFAVAGSKERWEAISKEKLVTYERLVHTRAGRLQHVTHVGFQGEDVGPTAQMRDDEIKDDVDALVIERPRAAQGVYPTPIPPTVERFHLRVPDDVAMILNATEAHRRGCRGDGVRVAMVDSGWFRHPFFETRGYKVETPLTVIPGTDPEHDPHGHGTGESANVFAVAPDAVLLPIRAADDAGHLVGALAGFMRAKTAMPSVITNSWGGDSPYPADPDLPRHPADRILELEIRDAIANNIVVVFAAGNGTFSVEAQVPGVISAGGVFADAELQLRATPYASGYASPWFRDDDGEPIKVPTVCGLVGLPPRAAYIMLPVPVGCRIDMERAVAGRNDPPDGTSPFDGWALFSGTSAAAPQVAGAVAVLRKLRPNAPPQEIAKRLCGSAIDVRAGRCHPRFDFHAAEGRDLATGDGLIDVSAAVGDWAPVPERGQAMVDLARVLAGQQLLIPFLKKLATDDKFRAAMAKDPDAALKSLGLKSNRKFTYREPVTVASKAKCKKVLEAVERGEPFEFIDTTGHVTFMLG